MLAPTTIDNKTFAANFSMLKVHDVSVLKTLPSTAIFTSLTINTNAVATQSWVTSQAYLTTLPSTASFSGVLSCAQLSCTSEIDTGT